MRNLCTNTECGFKVPFRDLQKASDHRTSHLTTYIGSTGVIKGFRSKAGKPFSATLYIDQNDRTVNFDFQNNTYQGKKYEDTRVQR